MKQRDAKEFQKAMGKEISGHETHKNWKVVPIKDVPKGIPIIPAVWSMKRKRRISTGEVYRYRACLNFDGSKQIYGLNYWETHAPVVTWPAVRFFLIQSFLNKWKSRQLDFVLAFPQATVETELYMKIPKGYNRPGISEKTHALKLLKNLYGQKQAGRVWHQHLVTNLIKRGFKQSKVDECIFYCKRSVFMVYVDDAIIMGPDDAELDEMFALLKKDFNVKEEGDGTLGDYLGIRINQKKDEVLHYLNPILLPLYFKI